MPGLTLFQKHYESLTGAELVMLGYYVNQLGDQGELASKMLTKSAEKMVASKNSLAAADALQIKAQIYAPFGSLAKFPKGTSAIARINGSAACIGRTGEIFAIRRGDSNGLDEH